jgi:dihydrolipoamide dehydrogenase
MVMGEQTLETQVAIIGAGPGGYAAAFRAADLGLDVTLINAEESLGGVCLLRGCIPVKVFVEVAGLLYDARQAKSWGIDFGEPEMDAESIWKRKDQVVNRLTKGLKTLADKRGVQVIHGRAVFESPEGLRLQDAEVDHVAFEHAIVATGSLPKPLLGKSFGDHDLILDTGKALGQAEIPERLLIAGAGHSGVEFAFMYANLGSKVTLVDIEDEILPGADRELVKPLKRRLERLCENIYLNTTIEAVQEDDDQVEVTLQSDSLEDGEQTYDRVLVAIGRTPNAEQVGLKEADIEVDDQGFIVVDEELRTSNEHIFAIGDVLGEPMYAHKALHQGKIAADVIAGEPAAFDVRCVPTVVFTEPQLAWCGLMEREAEEQGREIEVARFPWSASGRALTQGVRRGLTKLILEPENGRLLGMGIVGPGAENMIAEGALAIEMGALAQDMALTIHPHPTLSETEQESAEAFLGMPTHILSKS